MLIQGGLVMVVVVYALMWGSSWKLS